MAHEYTVEIFYDDSCDVFVGTSDAIPGLTIEEESREKLIETAIEIVPILLRENLNINVSCESVNVSIIECDMNRLESKSIYGLTYSWKDKSHLEQAYA